MNNTKNYSKRELDEKFEHVSENVKNAQNVIELQINTLSKDTRDSLLRIELQTTKHNGRMSKIERYLLVVGTAVGVIIALKFPDLLVLLKVVPLA